MLYIPWGNASLSGLRWVSLQIANGVLLTIVCCHFHGNLGVGISNICYKISNICYSSQFPFWSNLSAKKFDIELPLHNLGRLRVMDVLVGIQIIGRAFGKLQR